MTNSFKDVIEREEDGAICHIRCVEQQKQIQAREMQLKLEKERGEEETEQGKEGRREEEKKKEENEEGNQGYTKANRTVSQYEDDDDLFEGIMEDD